MLEKRWWARTRRQGDRTNAQDAAGRRARRDLSRWMSRSANRRDRRCRPSRSPVCRAPRCPSLWEDVGAERSWPCMLYKHEGWRRHARQGASDEQKKIKRLTVGDVLRPPCGRGERPPARPGPGRAHGAGERLENDGIVFIDEIDQDLRPLGPPRRRREPRGRAARPAAADRGHHGLHQARRHPHGPILSIASGAFHLEAGGPAPELRAGLCRIRVT